MKHTQDMVGHLFVYDALQKLLQKFSAVQRPLFSKLNVL